MSRRILMLAVIATLATGCSGGGEDAGAGAGDDAAVAAAGPSSLSVTGTDQLTFEPADLTATAGEVEVELTAGEGVGHSFVVEGVDGDRPVAEADAGATDTGTVELAAGTYTVYCGVPGHREGGMEATLEVS